MKTLMMLPVLALGLVGCAEQPVRYASSNPYEWRTVSVTPVQNGTAARSGAPVTYSSEPVYVQREPVYVAPQPVYMAPAPYYYAPAPAYAYPPVSIGFDFLFTSRHYHGRGGRRW
ncbi:hypothetical protein [Pseudoduganella violaceinigra]|uniref:hypothetical protein n=1 Tax=Pseudoduganella violaceinigra TaxID=246602 RepID=UPI0003FDABD0|nr:hypothetical protein [Pseudoduganella violaceinigra]